MVARIAVLLAYRGLWFKTSKLMTATTPRNKMRAAASSFLVIEDPKGGYGRVPFVGAVVVIVALTEVDDAPFSETELGDTVQVDSAGAPLQVSATV